MSRFFTFFNVFFYFSGTFFLYIYGYSVAFDVGIGWIWEKRTGDSDTGQAAELVLALGYRWRRTQWTWTDAEEGDVHQVNATRYSRPIYTLVLWFILNRNFLQWLLYTETIAVTWKVILHCTLTFWRCVASNITFFFIFAVLVVWYMYAQSTLHVVENFYVFAFFINNDTQHSERGNSFNARTWRRQPW